MTQSNYFTSHPVNRTSASKRMLEGAGIALILITIFLLGADESKPEWGKLWIVRPLVIVPLAGAGGGLFYYIMDHLSDRGGWRRPLAILLSLMVYLVALWMGTVLGLDGTMWD